MSPRLSSVVTTGKQGKSGGWAPPPMSGHFHGAEAVVAGGSSSRSHLIFASTYLELLQCSSNVWLSFTLFLLPLNDMYFKS